MSDQDGPTPFVESNALLAVQASDFAEAQRLVDEMLPSERRELGDACDNLMHMCRRANR